MIDIPNHTPVTRLGGTPGQREVWRTEFNGRPCVTRVLARDRLHVNFAASIRRIVLEGHGSVANLPENIQLTIEGYRVAANIPAGRGAGPDPRWPRALDAGLTPEGFVYVTTEWIDGAPLARIQPVAPDLRVPIARGVGRILAILHASNVAYGDLKAENLVIGPAGEVSLIDLDTMREVPGPTLAVPTRDLTLSWAAPEQRHQQQTYLASDLWAFGRLIRELFDEDVPEDWRALIAGCSHPSPLDRPRTASLVARLHDPDAPLVDWLDEPLRAPEAGTGERAGDDGKTQRVAESTLDPGRTERVAETSGPALDRPSPFQPAPDLPSARPSYALRSCIVIPLVGGLLGIGTCAGLGAWWDRTQIALANSAADDALAALKSYKTRPEVNRDTSQRTAIRAQADAAWNTRKTPHAIAVRALALVWEQGWQDGGRKWDVQKYDDGIAALNGAADEPAAAMARATVEGGACRLNRADARSAGHCDRALDAIGLLRKELPDKDDSNWLRVEAAWTEELVRGELAEQAVTAKTGEAPQRLAAVLATCDDARPYLSFGPVNAIELEQDCLAYAGLAGDWAHYFASADYLFDNDTAKNTMPLVYRSAGAQCADIPVKQGRSDWSVKGDPWCVAVGDAARGCVAAAQSDIAKNALTEPDQHWDSLYAALASRTERCRR